MSDDESILPKTPPSLRDHDFLWWTIAVGVLAGYVIPKLMARFPTKGHPENQPGTRKSRLVKEKFGITLMDEKNDHHDLQLKEAEEQQQEEIDMDINKNTTALEVAVQVSPSSEEESSSSSCNVSHHNQNDQPRQDVTVLTREEASQHSKQSSSNVVSSSTKKTKNSNNKSAPSSSSSMRPLVVFQNMTDRHPGLDSFAYWWDVQTSLYRIYTSTRADTGQPSDPPPYNPSSRRGKTSVDLRVTNETMDDTIVVYWINYTGGYESKGTIPPGHTWTQSTWIDHPWVFCNAQNDVPMVQYIPYQIIPNVVPEAPTVDLSDTITTTNNRNDDIVANNTTIAAMPKKRLIGIHRFSIVKLSSNSNHNTIYDERKRMYSHWIRDDILPLSDDITTEQQALELTLLHCVRTGYYHWKTLLQYWQKIQQHPDQSQYRHIRIANRTFSDAIWNTAARGVFLCTGWIEHGAHLELGMASRPYPRINDLYRIIATIQRWQKRAENDASLFPAAEQPEGVDGYGRSGFH